MDCSYLAVDVSELLGAGHYELTKVCFGKKGLHFKENQRRLNRPRSGTDTDATVSIGPSLCSVTNVTGVLAS